MQCSQRELGRPCSHCQHGPHAGQKNYHHGDLRAALVEAAAALIAEAGVDRFSLREAARALGVSANATYRHFADKSALLTAVANDGFEALSERMKGSLLAVEQDCSPSSAELRFKATGRAYVEFALENPQLFGLMFGSIGLPCLARGTELTRPTPYDLLSSVLDELVSSGLLSKEGRSGAELKAWSVVHGFATLVLGGASSYRSAPERAQALEAVLDFAFRGLCAAVAD